MKIIVNSQIIIENPSKEIKEYCKSTLTIKNPDIAKKQAMGFWTGNIPKYIKMFTINENKYILPLGCIDDIFQIHNKLEDYDIQFIEHEKLKFPENNLEPYPYQEKAINEMIKAKRGILVAKCGAGKSIMALEIIRRLGYKALILCHTKELCDKFKNYVVDNLGMKKGEYGIIANGKIEIGKFITIALRQTMVKADLLQLRNEFNTIIIDECHLVSGNSTYVSQYQKILSNLVAKYRIGITATAFRNDGLTPCLFALLNKVKYEIPEEEIADKIIKAKVMPIFTNYRFSDNCIKYDGTLLYQQLSNELARDKERNDLILKLLKENKTHYCLVLSDRLEGLQYLHDNLGEGVFINGQMVNKKAKAERENAIKDMRSGKEHILFSSFGIAREGLDIPRLDRLFLIAPTKNKAALIQSTGRIERTFEGKDECIVYDFVDINEIYYARAWKARKTIYKGNGNLIIDKN